MNEKVAVLSKKPTDVIPSSNVPDFIDQAFQNDPDFKLDPTLREPISNQVTVSRAKSFNIHVNQQSANYSQYVNTVKAYALAGMPFEHIANAGEALGDKVEREELDAAIKEGWQEKAGEVVESESKVLAWQNRGEQISITPQIASTGSYGGTEVVVTSQNLAPNQTTQPHTLNVVEGIAVTNIQPQPLEYSSPQTTANEDHLRRFIGPLNDADLKKPAA